MAGDLLPVQPHHGVVGHSVEAQHPARALGHGEGRAVVYVDNYPFERVELNLSGPGKSKTPFEMDSSIKVS